LLTLEAALSISDVRIFLLKTVFYNEMIKTNKIAIIAESYAF
jgi:hypothetical protein